MRFVADESVDKQIVDRLRAGGHSVVSIAESEPSVRDEIVLARSREQDAVLVTADKDFGELVFRQHLATPMPSLLDSACSHGGHFVFAGRSEAQPGRCRPVNAS